MGIQLQKLSLMQHPDDVSPWRQVKWVLGFYLIFSGSLIDFLAFGLAPQSLLAPLAALTLIWNIFMSSRFLGETYTRFDIYATATIFFGTVVTIIYADHKEETFTLEELKALYRRTKMVTYSVLMPLFIGTHYAGTVFIGRAQAEQPPRFLLLIPSIVHGAELPLRLHVPLRRGEVQASHLRIIRALCGGLKPRLVRLSCLLLGRLLLRCRLLRRPRRLGRQLRRSWACGTPSVP